MLFHTWIRTNERERKVVRDRIRYSWQESFFSLSVWLLLLDRNKEKTSSFFPFVVIMFKRNSKKKQRLLSSSNAQDVFRVEHQRFRRSYRAQVEQDELLWLTSQRICTKSFRCYSSSAHRSFLLLFERIFIARFAVRSFVPSFDDEWVSDLFQDSAHHRLLCFSYYRERFFLFIDVSEIKSCSIDR